MWTNVTTEASPGRRVYSGMAYDEKAQASILYGGGWGVMGLRDTWAYNCSSSTWTRIEVPSFPDNGLPFVMSFDSHAERVILFSWGGTWTFSSGTNSWYDMNPTTGIPGFELGVCSFCMAYDCESDRTVLFGDSGGRAETWAYSYQDNTWMNMAWVDDGVFSFIAYGDTRGDGAESVSPLHEDIVQLFCQHDPEFVIHTGDMVRSGAEAYQWDDFNDTISVLWNLEIPMYGAPGNHEIYSDGVTPPDEGLVMYQSFFDYTDVIEEPGETELFYSFDEHGIHFISLNTATDWVGGEGYVCATEQMEWLEDDLAEEHNFTVVFFHYPAWSVRLDRPDRWAQAESIRNTFHEIFVEHGVDLVFNGHDHLYYRTCRNGTQYVITGGGGAPLTDVQREGTVWQDGDVGFGEYHYCIAVLVEDQLDVEVYLLNGTLADSFSFEIPSLLPTTTPTTTTTTAPDSPGISAEMLLVISSPVVILAIAIVMIRREAASDR